ncbi:unnamed protein product [Rotaria sordida]|uniref:Uncharacterized protein n=1 Tax=Rotaria sordida TaxID=392033 RepID=A0A814T1C0_9BILA|nr:unnamed protein product [Rotaria sordida]
MGIVWSNRLHLGSVRTTKAKRPVNTTHKETLKVFSGNTNINSTNRCIALGISFDLWGQLPIQYPQETGNGGCDALWAKECSKNILAKLVSSFQNIKDRICGVPIPDILLQPPPGCPPKNSSHSGISSTVFLHNGTFMINSSEPTDPSKSWVYYQSDPSIDGDYNELMKYFVFTYFVGRGYISDSIDAAISSGTSTLPKMLSFNSIIFVIFDIYSIAYILRY